MFKGYLYAILTALIWSFWFVISRLGVTGNLAPIDIMFVRYLTASLILLPFFRHLPFKKLGWKNIVIISFCLGFVYNLFSLFGLILFLSNQGAVVIAGFNPIFNMLYQILSKKPIDKKRYLAVFLIFISVITFLTGGGEEGIDGVESSGEGIDWTMRGLGFFLLLLASGSYSLGIWLLDNKYRLTPKEVLTTNSYFNLLYFIPLYFFFGNPEMMREHTGELLFHAFYQGVMATILTVYFVSVIAKTIGSTVFSFFIAGIPILTTFFAFLMNEPINSQDIVAAVICTVGILVGNLGGKLEKILKKIFRITA